jgi:hypothetical protein
VMLNPRLENSEVGLGLSARRMRERFLSTFETCYYIQPINQAALLRCYPQSWQVWLPDENGMQLLSESLQRPSMDDLDRVLSKSTGSSSSFLSRLQQFFNALSR